MGEMRTWENGEARAAVETALSEDYPCFDPDDETMADHLRYDAEKVLAALGMDGPVTVVTGRLDSIVTMYVDGEFVPPPERLYRVVPHPEPGQP